jgi:glycosyltransferase involved in cell wall biosynthesis
VAGHIRRFATLGNHLPRQCGIATFTTHLTDALVAELPETDAFVLAMNDAGRRHAYPSRVRFEIGDADLGSYRRAADFLNVNQVDVLSVQHEYGIFGGKAGAHLLELLRALRMPIVTTLHTILSEPSPPQRAVLEELARLSERLIVMSKSGAELLTRVHGIPAEQIDLIPHGIPEVPVDGGSKERLGLDGKTVILTFGLLSRDKGIEYVIDALPEILAADPQTVYVVLGATHPHVVEREGEAYRLMLETRGRHLGVSGSMIFHNRFVSQAELTEFLSAADIYITPYLNPAQITSGTLAYAVGAGKAVISTPYVYARELLADGRGARGARAVERLERHRARGRRLGARRRPLSDHVRPGGRARAYDDMGGGRPSVRRDVLTRSRKRDAPPPQLVRSADACQSPCRLARNRSQARQRLERRHWHPAARRVQHSTVRGWVLPRRQRARLALDDTSRGSRQRRPGRRAGPGHALPRLREFRIRPIHRPLPELSLVRKTVARTAWVRGQPGESPLGARRGDRSSE